MLNLCKWVSDSAWNHRENNKRKWIKAKTASTCSGDGQDKFNMYINHIYILGLLLLLNIGRKKQNYDGKYTVLTYCDNIWTRRYATENCKNNIVF